MFKEKCNKLLKCGHKCSLFCGEVCSSRPCREIINVELLCGHTNKIECNIKDNIEEAICQEKCNKLLPCGHNCQGTCGLCLQGTLHVKCSVKCGRILSCGHVCSQKCSSECLCDQKCPNICEHGYCNLIVVIYVLIAKKNAPLDVNTVSAKRNVGNYVQGNLVIKDAIKKWIVDINVLAYVEKDVQKCVEYVILI